MNNDQRENQNRLDYTAELSAGGYICKQSCTGLDFSYIGGDLTSRVRATDYYCIHNSICNVECAFEPRGGCNLL